MVMVNGEMVNGLMANWLMVNGEMLGETRAAKAMVALVASDHDLVIDTTEEIVRETKAKAMVALLLLQWSERYG